MVGPVQPHSCCDHSTPAQLEEMFCQKLLAGSVPLSFYTYRRVGGAPRQTLLIYGWVDLYPKMLRGMCRYHGGAQGITCGARDLTLCARQVNPCAISRGHSGNIISQGKLHFSRSLSTLLCNCSIRIPFKEGGDRDVRKMMSGLRGELRILYCFQFCLW